MKKQLLSIAMLLFSSMSIAETFPPSTIKATKATGVTKQSTATASDNSFTYPTQTHLESDAIVNDVVFFHTLDMLDYFDNDYEMLVDYVQRSIDVNNNAFRRQDIALRRNIAGIVLLPEDSEYKDTRNKNDRLFRLKKEYLNPDYGYQFHYDVSYVVALNRYHKDIVSSLGAAWMGDKYSWISPTEQNATERTLAHELGHNDGLAHDSEAAGQNGAIMLTDYAIGAKCDSFVSIMKSGSGDRSELFFSSPIVKSDKGTDCGKDEEEDSARAYRQAVEYGIRESIRPFKNNKPSREKTGTVSLSFPNTVINEGDDLTVEVYWSGSELGDVVQVLTRKGTADTEDFTSTLRSVYYNGEDDVSRFVIPTKDDNIYERDEIFIIEAINPHGVSIEEETARTTITMVSDELGQSGTVSFESNTVNIVEGKSASITLTRKNGSDGSFTLRVVSSHGTAGNDDYDEVDEEVTFADGETSKNLLVRTRTDSNSESNEKFSLLIQGDADLIGVNNELTVSITEPPAPPQESDNEAKSSGGSMSLATIFIALMLLIRRRV